MQTTTAYTRAKPPHGDAARFRDPAARDRAWGRFYGRHGLNPCTRSLQPLSAAQRKAAYAFRRALVEGAQQ